MAVDQYKALTHINLPFIEKRFAPGDFISHSDFEAYADAGASTLRLTGEDGESPLHTADSIIEEFLEWGTISEDPDAPIHPQNVIPNPNQPTVASLVAQAELLVEQLEENNQEVPAKLRALAGMSERQISSVDAGVGVDRHVDG